MTKDEFVYAYTAHHHELYEFADGAALITDCDELKKIALNYLEARQALENGLDAIGIEKG